MPSFRGRWRMHVEVHSMCMCPVCVSGVISAQHCRDPFSCRISELHSEVQPSVAEQPLHRA